MTHGTSRVVDTPQTKENIDCSDEELAKRVITDPEVFGVLMARYESKLMTYIMRKTSTTYEGAQDILQESFLKAYQNINNFDPRLSFSSWIYRIVHNATISQWRKSSIRPEGNVAHVDDEFLSKLKAEGDIGVEIDRSFLEEHIESIFGDMDQKYRNVLVLRFMEDKSYEEISDIIKKPMGTVATYISRAKKQFQARYAKEAKDFATGTP